MSKNGEIFTTQETREHVNVKISANVSALVSRHFFLTKCVSVEAQITFLRLWLIVLHLIPTFCSTHPVRRPHCFWLPSFAVATSVILISCASSHLNLRSVAITGTRQRNKDWKQRPRLIPLPTIRESVSKRSKNLSAGKMQTRPWLSLFVIVVKIKEPNGRYPLTYWYSLGHQSQQHSSMKRNKLPWLFWAPQPGNWTHGFPA